MTCVAVAQLSRRQMETTDKSGDEHHQTVIRRERRINLLHDGVGGQMPLDSRAEERYGSGHEHRCGHAFATDISDDERHIIAIPVEIIQVAADALHGHQRSMERELIIIDKIMH